MQKQKRFQRGFTLIELLVVIAIIGLLATVVVVSLNSARTKARDARRKTDMQASAKALELYAGQNASYPVHATAVVSTSACGAWIAELTVAYILALPCDPKEASYHYYYATDATGKKYELNAFMEKDTAAAANDGGNNNVWYEVGSDLTLMGAH